MKVHVVSETQFVTKGQGVHTAFIEHVELLKEKNDVKVVVNSEGLGDVMHSHTYGPYFFWKGLHYKGRRVFTVHVIPDSIKGSLPMWKYWYPIVKWYFKQVYSYADVCIAISPTVEQAIRDLGSETEIVNIANPIPIDRWKRTDEKRKKGRAMFNLSENDFVVLGVGQLEGRKGIDDFIDIAEAIPGAKFIWAGGRPFGAFTEGIKRLNERIARASPHISFVGLIDLENMPYLYAAGDALLFPSFQENCPLAPLEAAACGMPVVFRDLKEYTTLYEHPYLKAANKQEFIELTRKLIHDQLFYQEGLKISDELLTQFDKAAIREKLIVLYQSLIDTYCTNH